MCKQTYHSWEPYACIFKMNFVIGFLPFQLSYKHFSFGSLFVRTAFFMQPTLTLLNVAKIGGKIPKQTKYSRKPCLFRDKYIYLHANNHIYHNHWSSIENTIPQSHAWGLDGYRTYFSFQDVNGVINTAKTAISIGDGCDITFKD